MIRVVMLFLILTIIIGAQATITTDFFKNGVADAAYISCNTSSQVLYTGHTSHGLPIYANSNISNPTLRKIECLSWGDDPILPKNASPISVRPQHPRIIAPMYKWNRLPFLMQQDPYLRKWNESIFQQARIYYSMPPVQYLPDGDLQTGSGILDCARRIQLRVKLWAYAYRMSNDTRWASRTWEELLVASGNSSQYFGVPGDNWNSL